MDAMERSKTSLNKGIKFLHNVPLALFSNHLNGKTKSRMVDSQLCCECNWVFFTYSWVKGFKNITLDIKN
jgi:hypothetical protein